MAVKEDKPRPSKRPQPIIVRRWSVLAEVRDSLQAFGAIAEWWNGPTVEGRPVTERIEWESDDHSFVLTIEPLTPIERMDGSTPAPPLMTRLDERD